MLQGKLERELEDNGDEEHEGHDGQWSGRLRVISRGDGKEADEANLGKVDTSEELTQSLLVCLTLGVEVGLVYVEEVVTESNVDERETNGSETEDKRSDSRVGNGNDTQVDPLGKLGAPRGSRELGEVVEDLTRCLARQDASKKNYNDESTNVEEGTGSRGESQENEVTDVEVGSLGQVGSQELKHDTWVV